MKKIWKSLVCAIALCFSTSSFAALSLDNISESDLKKVINDFSAVFQHTTVAPASSLGKLFGIELGLVAGSVSTPGVKAIAAEAGESVDGIPHGALLAAVSVPMGFTIELNYIPVMDFGDAKFGNTSIGGKWTMTDTLLDLPLDLALRGSITKSELSFTQKVSAVDTKTTFKDTITSFGVVASKSFVIVEPYVGLGFVKADGELSVAGSNTIFDFTSSTSAKASPSGTYFNAGVQANLLFFRLGLEYAKAFDSSRMTGKFAFSF